MSRVPVGVLVSGSGTNLQALLDAGAAPGFPARIAVVISNRPAVAALDRAAAAGVPAVLIDHRPYRGDRAAFDAALVAALRARSVEWVACAGFMRVLTPVLLDAFPGRVLNIHPALLPAFPGLHAQRQALEAGVAIAGCTVHLVDDGVDTGPILAQAAVPVHAQDDEAALSARILAAEHRLYPEVLRWAAEGRIEVEGGRVRVRGAAIRGSAW